MNRIDRIVGDKGLASRTYILFILFILSRFLSASVAKQRSLDRMNRIDRIVGDNGLASRTYILFILFILSRFLSASVAKQRSLDRMNRIDRIVGDNGLASRTYILFILFILSRFPLCVRSRKQRSSGSRMLLDYISGCCIELRVGCSELV